MSNLRLLALALIGGVATLNASADPRFELEIEPKYRFDEFVVEQNFYCLSGWRFVREYTLSWPGCQGGLSYACTETHELVEQCISGNMVTVSDTVIDRQCDYTGSDYTGSSCPVEKLPWPK